VILYVIYKSVKETRQYKKFDIGKHFVESSKKIDHPFVYFSGLFILGLAFLGFCLPYFYRRIYEVCHTLWHTFSAIGFALIHISMKDYLLEWRKAHKEKILYNLSKRKKILKRKWKGGKKGKKKKNKNQGL